MKRNIRETQVPFYTLVSGMTKSEFEKGSTIDGRHRGIDLSKLK